MSLRFSWLLLLGVAAAPALADEAEIMDVRLIGDTAPHNAFTDLIRFKGQWICAYRDGKGHVSPDGALRFLTSGDGVKWQSFSRIFSPSADLRDPKLSIRPDGKLMVIAAAVANPPAQKRHQTMAWTSDDGVNWSAPRAIGEPDVWLWRVTWNGDDAYGVGYGTGGQRFARLYQGGMEKPFAPIVPTLQAENYPNESTLLFNADGSALCLLRRDAGDGSGLLGKSKPPYREWDWTKLGVKLGGPNLIRLPDGRIIVGTRLYDGKVRMSICELDPEAGRLKELIALPSGGDCSYPGLVWHDGLLWVSYYSSHEKGTKVYLARVKLSKP